MKIGEPATKLRHDIQALRGIAVLLVVLYHAGLPGLSAGYLGVDIFFVISGFLITGIIRRGIEGGDFSFRAFYYRRAKRLLPAAYVVITATVFLSPWFLSELAIQDLRAQVLGALTFTANFVMWSQTGYFEAGGDTKALLHFWSLAIEEQYYLMMPVFLFLLPRSFWLTSVGALLLLSFGIAIWQTAAHPDAAFYLLPARLWELALGSIGALLPVTFPGRRLISLARLPAAVVLIVIPIWPTGLPHPGVDALLVCLATLILILGRNGTMLETATPVRALARVGDFSYSLYLVHWPVIVFTRSAFLEEAPTSALTLAVLVSLILSWALYRFVEEPCRRGFNRSPARTVGCIVAASLAIATAPTVIGATMSSSVNYSEMLRRNYGLDPICAEKKAGWDQLPDACKSTQRPSVLLWGDSFAMMWAQALGDAMPQGIAQATLPRCTPMFEASISPIRASADDKADAIKCLDFNRSAMAYVRGDPDIEFVVISSPFAAPVSRASNVLTRSGDEIASERLTETIAVEHLKAIANAVQEAGKRFIILAPPPRLRVNMAECQERRMRGLVSFGPLADCAIPEMRWRKERKRIIEFLDKVASTGIPVLHPSEFLCRDGSCATEMNDVIIYRDHGHLSYAGADLIARKWDIAGRLMKSAQ